MPKIGDKIEIVCSDNPHNHYLNAGQVGVITDIEHDTLYGPLYSVVVKETYYKDCYIKQFIDSSDFKVIE